MLTLYPKLQIWVIARYQAGVTGQTSEKSRWPRERGDAIPDTDSLSDAVRDRADRIVLFEGRARWGVAEAEED